jgi:hypothetical protein
MVNIKRARGADEDVIELCKYVSKPPFVKREGERVTPETAAERLFDYFEATYRVPMVQTFGKFHAADDQHVTITIDVPAAVCPECGSDDIINQYQDPALFQHIAPDLQPDPGGTAA